MSDAWNEIQAIKSKRNSLREKLEKRKRERQDILSDAITTATSTLVGGSTNASAVSLDGKSTSLSGSATTTASTTTILTDADPDVERLLLQILSDQALALPCTSQQLFQRMNSLRFKPVTHAALNYYLEKLAAQSYVSMQRSEVERDVATMTPAIGSHTAMYVLTMVEHGRVQSLFEQNDSEDADRRVDSDAKRKCEYFASRWNARIIL